MGTPLYSKKPTLIGHRQTSDENLIKFGFADLGVVSDRILQQQNWNKRYHIDKFSMARNNPKAGKPVTILKNVEFQSTIFKMLPRQPDVTWEFYTGGSRDPDSCNTGAGLVVYKNGIQTF